jgi:hypothetical protein
MRCVGRGIALAVIAATPHGVAAAQVARPVLRAAGRVEWRTVAPLWPMSTTSERSTRGDKPSGSRGAFATPVSVAGGAAVGAWLGYFLSQVMKSDWEGMRAGERAAHRRTFAMSGAVVGALVGYLVRPRSGALPVRASEATYFYVPPSARHYITRAELRRAPVVNALEAVQTLRPEWLLPANAETRATTPGASSSDAIDSAIAVYVVDTRIGGPDALVEISIPELEELRLYEPQEAERRWGSPHPRGAIEVVPAAGQVAK